MNTEINKQDWGKFFDKLSKRRSEWMTEVEVLKADIGDQILTNGLPLNGITAETVADGRVHIEISVGESVNNHQAHTIQDPIRVSFLEDGRNSVEMVAIEEKDGTKTLVRFTEPMGILVGFAEYAVMATV